MILFKDIFGKKVEADFQGGEVSSDAGLLFLREEERTEYFLKPLKVTPFISITVEVYSAQGYFSFL